MCAVLLKDYPLTTQTVSSFFFFLPSQNNVNVCSNVFICANLFLNMLMSRPHPLLYASSLTPSSFFFYSDWFFFFYLFYFFCFCSFFFMTPHLTIKRINYHLLALLCFSCLETAHDMLSVTPQYSSQYWVLRSLRSDRVALILLM